MRSLTVAAPAKLNLYLEILGRDNDAYHRLETIFQTIEWADRVRLTPDTTGTITLDCHDPDVPTGPDNLAWQAAGAYLQAAGTGLGCRIELHKMLPSGGGLGGGSSDAAAVLRALDRLAPAPMPPARLARIALDLGADVPFFLLGGRAHATGRGERLTPLPDPPPVPVTVVVPALSCSTPAVFAALTDAERGPRPALGPEAFAGTPDRRLHNRLQAAAARTYPDLAPVYAACADLGAAWTLTGSGACCLLFGHHRLPGLRCVHTRLRRRADLDRL